MTNIWRILPGEAGDIKLFCCSVTVCLSFFIFKGGSPLTDDKLQECFKKAVKRFKKVRDLIQTAFVDFDR